MKAVEYDTGMCVNVNVHKYQKASEKQSFILDTCKHRKQHIA